MLIENSKDRSTEITVLTATGKACEVDAAHGDRLISGNIPSLTTSCFHLTALCFG